MQLVGEELFTILPFLALLYWLNTRRGMGRTASIIIATLAVSILFAAIHLPTYRWNIPHALVALVPIRIVLLLPYFMTKNAWVSSGTHILNDWLIFGLPLLLASAAEGDKIDIVRLPAGKSMNKQPNWWTGVAIYLLYLLVFIGTWDVVGADYTNLVGRDVVFRSVVLPLTLGAVFLVPAVTWLGWWRPAMTETRRIGPAWTMWAVLAIMARMVVIGLAATDWAVLTADHIVLIALGSVLVGFNEELLTRGVLVVTFRGSMRPEVWVCIFATLLFGLLHLPNAFFGIGLIRGLMQVIFATCAGFGFYVLRRNSGALILPMVAHGVWDFSSFVHNASGAGSAAIAPVFQFGTYLVSIVAVIFVLRHGAKRRAQTPHIEGEMS